MHNSTPFLAIFGASLGCFTALSAGFGSAHAQGVRNERGVGESQVAFSTNNLLQNGEFDLGTSSWTPSGSGLKWAVQNREATFSLSPTPGLQPSHLSISQIVQKPMRAGKTLALRFRAKGNGRLGVTIYETGGARRTLLANRFRAPGNEFQTFTVAVKTTAFYHPSQLAVRFNLGFEPCTLTLSQIRLVDMGDTELRELSLTPDETQLPDLTNSESKILDKARLAPPDPTPQPVVVRPVEVKPVTTSRLSQNLLRNVEFSQSDQFWNAWGQGVSAQVVGKALKMRLSPKEGAQLWDFGLTQTIDAPLNAGKVHVKLRAQGNVRFMCKIDETNGEKRTLFARTEKSDLNGQEHSFTFDLPKRYNAGETSFVLFFGQDVGELTVSDFSVVNEETVSSTTPVTVVPVTVVPVTVTPVTGGRRVEVASRFGSTGLNGEDFQNATDGNLQTTFDAASPSDGFVGFGAAQNVRATKIRFAPRGWLKDRMIGGKFQVADSQNGPWTDLHTISKTPEPFKWNEITLQNAPSGQFFRYVGAPNTHSNIGDFEVWGE